MGIKINDELKRTVRDWAAKHKDVRRVWLFGSAARGSCEADDLDIYVEAWSGAWVFDNEKWSTELQKLFTFKVHLVECQRANRDLYKEVQRDGILIIDKGN